jgi:sugar phosphate isomerase/epimerase
MEIAYCTWSMRDVPLEEGLPVIAQIGYTGIELAVTPGWPTELYTLDAATRRRIRELLAAYDLTLAAIAGHTTVCAEDPDEHAANMQRLRDTIDLADDLRQKGHTPVVVSLVGGDVDDWGRLKHLVAERVAELGGYAASKGVIFAPEMHSGTAMDLPRKAVWLVEQVNHPSVKLNFDISHTEIEGMPTEEACRAMGPPHGVHPREGPARLLPLDLRVPHPRGRTVRLCALPQGDGCCRLHGVHRHGGERHGAAPAGV